MRLMIFTFIWAFPRMSVLPFKGCDKVFNTLRHSSYGLQYSLSPFKRVFKILGAHFLARVHTYQTCSVIFLEVQKFSKTRLQIEDA
jgi:hypothetical protein